MTQLTKYECPECSVIAEWTDGLTVEAGDERDEFWCQACGAESPLSLCRAATGSCNVCGDTIEPGSLADILDHIRVIHPDIYGDGPERWSDGSPVIHVSSDELTPQAITSLAWAVESENDK